MLENANADLEDISRVKDEEKMQLTNSIKKLEGEKEALLKERPDAYLRNMARMKTIKSRVCLVM